jgi:hypothetical protein
MPRADRIRVLAMYLIDSTAFTIAWRLFLLLGAVFWVSLAYWVYRDARRRTDDPWLVGTAAVLALAVPYVGPVVYLLFRGPETLADERLRGLEIHALEARREAHAKQCPVCRAGVEAEFVVCPVCTTRLKHACAKCDGALEPAWQVCPWCATPAGAVLVEVGLDTALTAEAVARKGKRPAPVGLS